MVRLHFLFYSFFLWCEQAVVARPGISSNFFRQPQISLTFFHEIGYSHSIFRCRKFWRGILPTVKIALFLKDRTIFGGGLFFRCYKFQKPAIVTHFSRATHCLKVEVFTGLVCASPKSCLWTPQSEDRRRKPGTYYCRTCDLTTSKG